MPRKIDLVGGAHEPGAHAAIYLDPSSDPALRTAADQVVELLAERGIDGSLTASRPPASGHDPAEGVDVVLRIDPTQVPQVQGYRLAITPRQIVVVGHDAAGVFYASQTLKQLCRLHRDRALPCLRIVDWPDFTNRGLMLDISRDRVPRMDYLFALIDMLAEWKINQFQLYTEHTFAYREHKAVWRDASPLTPDQLLALDAYCKQRHIELVPNQNAFGHFERWLKHEPYAQLAAQPEGGVWWGRHHPAAVLNPLDPRSIQLLRGMFAELLPHFTSRQFNVGCDETWELGHGRTREACEQRGVGRVYLGFLLKILDEVRAHGRTMQFWGDIILQHPELIRELPDDVIAMAWGYGPEHPYAEQCPQFEDAGIPFYVCPGTAAWSSIIGRADIAMANIPLAARHGFRHGAVGLLNTDWGDHGHHQPPSVSWPGYALGAAMSWSASRAIGEQDLAAVLDAHVYRDQAGVMGRVMLALGQVHNTFGLFHRVLTSPDASFTEGELAQTPLASFEKAEQQLADLAEAIAGARMQRPDAADVEAEVAAGIELARHACRRALWVRLAGGDPAGLSAAQRDDLGRHLDDTIQRYRAAWLKRSREGGLADSVGRSDWLLTEYGRTPVGAAPHESVPVS